MFYLQTALMIIHAQLNVKLQNKIRSCLLSEQTTSKILQLLAY